MLPTDDEEKIVEEKAVSCRVGQYVDTVAQGGNPARITGFQTHDSPVLLQQNDRAEIGSEEFIPATPIIEGVVLLLPNPDYVPPENPKI